MYQEHFGLKLAPFTLGPDPRFLYLTDTVRDALGVLAYGVAGRNGIIQLTGEVGTGKTTLLNVFLGWLDRRGDSTAVITNPHLPASDLLEAMWTDFGLEQVSASGTQRALSFNRWLLERYRAGRLVVLIVDEAQQLSGEVLEELRLLTNMETPQHKLLQIVLCGQPELEEVLRRPGLKALRQRIVLRCTTRTFSLEQTTEYVRHRMHIAGARGADAFPPDVLRLVHAHSGGIARLINVLCEQSLMRCSRESRHTVTAEMVDGAAAELGLTEAEEPRSSARSAEACAALQELEAEMSAMEKGR